MIVTSPDNNNKKMRKILPHTNVIPDGLFDPTVSGERNIRQRLTSIVQCATLAPSSHNTQCWKFVIDSENITIAIRPDLNRQCPVIDPDNHNVYATLGCAVENIVVAARAYGLKADVNTSDLSKEGIGIWISFRECEVYKSDLFYAIPKRQCNR